MLTPLPPHAAINRRVKKQHRQVFINGETGFDIGFKPAKANIYDIIIDKKTPPLDSSATSYLAQGEAAISIRDMLSGVKDYRGKIASARKLLAIALLYPP